MVNGSIEATECIQQLLFNLDAPPAFEGMEAAMLDSTKTYTHLRINADSVLSPTGQEPAQTEPFGPRVVFRYTSTLFASHAY